MEISARDLHNDMIKQFEIGGLDSVVNSDIQKVLISDTTSRLFIPPQFHKMTTRLCHICGCEFFITPKNMRINLNQFREIL